MTPASVAFIICSIIWIVCIIVFIISKDSTIKTLFYILQLVVLGFEGIFVGFMNNWW